MNDGRTRGTLVVLDLAGLPPLPETVDGLVLGEVSRRGEAVTVGAGETGWENQVVLPS